MDPKTDAVDMNEIPKDESEIQRGKTKIIQHWDDVVGRKIVRCYSTDNISAGDGKRKDVIAGKGIISNGITSDVFEFLKMCGVPVAFHRREDDRSFIADRCAMLPLEIVVSRTAPKGSSMLKQHPDFLAGQIFGKLVYRLFLKTSNQEWNGAKLPADDPLMVIEDEKVHLYDPHKVFPGQEPFLTITLAEVLPGIATPDLRAEKLWEIKRLVTRTFLLLEKAYHLGGGFSLLDLKAEVGLNNSGQLRLADVIDAESIRIMRDGLHFDKQPYRNKGASKELNEEFMASWAEVKKATARFEIPRQQIIFWKGSKSDDTEIALETLRKFKVIGGAYHGIGDMRITYTEIIDSAHKQPISSMDELRTAVHAFPDSVGIGFVGMSNAAGPMLSANTGIPFFTTPTTFKEFPDDTLSSLRTPSNVPVATVLRQDNIALAALRVLAVRNPLLWALLQEDLEERQTNFIVLDL